MNAKLTPGQAAELRLDQCLLCGGSAQVLEDTPAELVVSELCAVCNSAFHFLAVGLELLEATAPAAAEIPGQLELDEEEA